jgi:hypothetical protein
MDAQIEGKYLLLKQFRGLLAASNASILAVGLPINRALAKKLWV